MHACLLLIYSSVILRQCWRGVVVCEECTITYSYLSYFKTFMSFISKLYIYWDLKFEDMWCKQTLKKQAATYALQHKSGLYCCRCFYLQLFVEPPEGVMGIWNICNGRCLCDNFDIKPLFPYHFSSIWSSFLRSLKILGQLQHILWRATFSKWGGFSDSLAYKVCDLVVMGWFLFPLGLQ